MTGDLLARLDAAIDGLCPCGANPRPGSAYCSYDCQPTHHGEHTISDRDGTPMRWRPDMITAHDDSNLELVCANIPIGRHNGTMYRRGATDVLHLRLDDGHRYVGLDVDAPTDEPGVSTTAIRTAWDRLERELNDQRRLEPDPAAEIWSAYLDWAQVHIDWQVTRRPITTNHDLEAVIRHYRIADALAARTAPVPRLFRATGG